MNFEGKQQSLLTFRVGPVLCCAPSFPVRSIITPPKLTHLPGSDSSHPGIFKHGSHIVKVLDLRQKFGIEQSEQTQPGNLIITIFETENFAFWVDQILDVFDFPSAGWGNLPAAIPRGVFSRTLLLNKKIHLYSEFEKLATINDLGYLKHYIQQLKKQQDAQETEQQQKKITLEATSPVKPDETKHNPVKEIKKLPVVKKDKPTHIEKTISKTPSLNSTPTSIPVSKNKTPKIEINKTPVVKPITTITTATSTRERIKPEKHNKKPAVIIGKKPNITKQPSYSSTSTTEDESSSFGIILLFTFILFSLGAGIYYLFINTVISNGNDKYTQEQISISAAPVDYGINKTPVLEERDLENITSSQDEMNSSPEMLIADTESEKDNKPLNNENKKVIDELTQNENSSSPSTQSEDDSITKDVEDTAYRADIIQQDNDITITLHQPILEEKLPQEEIAITPLQPEDSVINEIELEQTVKAEKTVNEVIHIVVKGDTLWAIAKKYIHNPFLYPELARLSNIKNPHLIYPGNRVRIRFIKE